MDGGGLSKAIALKAEVQGLPVLDQTMTRGTDRMVDPGRADFG
jgi:hypothetical protein